MAEKKLLNQILLSISKTKCRLFRNNTGKGWTGSKKSFKTINGVQVLIIENPRPLNAGLFKGSSDLIGWTTVQITPEMVGSEIAIFTAIEAKTGKTRVSAAQKTFIERIKESGGIAGIAKNEQDARELISSFPN